MKIRIKFQKQGALKFIGHLDVMRYFQKMNRRAQLDVRYTEGFSPHQEMSLANPLSLGMTSSSEYADIEFLSWPSRQELIDKLNAVNVPELWVLDARMLPEKAKNAMSITMAADYTLTFREGYEPENIDEWYEKFFTYTSQPEIIVTKQTKTNTVEVDLKKQIYELERRGDSLFMKIATGSQANLKPELLLSSFYASMGQEFNELMFTMNRDELYGEEGGKLKALLDYGYDFAEGSNT